jgi:hypothetical protein
MNTVYLEQGTIWIGDISMGGASQFCNNKNTNIVSKGCC